MSKFFLSVSLFLSLSLLQTGNAIALSNEDASEEWGYVEVRPKAHMFWWLYRSPNRVEDPSKPWPVILWLQGGPGVSGIALGNFDEVGPLDAKLKTRESTWLNKADLLFVDNPVGTGYSYVEDNELLVKTDEEAATDLTTLLMKIFNENENLQKSPLHIVAESYGGKFAVTLAVSALKAIEDGKLKLILGGVALGDTWISPEDFVLSWGPLLKDLSRLDDNGLQQANSLAQKIKQELKDGLFVNATNTWLDLEESIYYNSNGVSFYNFLSDSGSDSSSISETKLVLYRGSAKTISYSRYLRSLRSNLGTSDEDLERLLNGVIKQKLQIVPDNLIFQVQSMSVFECLKADFMKPRIKEVDELLAKGVRVTVYNGQLDLICATKGVEAWVKKLKWESLQSFLGKERTVLHCGKEKTTKGFFRSHKNLYFYWILKAGHYVPEDQPCIALKMLGEFTQSPATST